MAFFLLNQEPSTPHNNRLEHIDGSYDNMGTMSVPSRTLCLTLEVVNGGIWFLDGKRLEPKELLWQQQ